jgi:hypothetical protein
MRIRDNINIFNKRIVIFFIFVDKVPQINEIKPRDPDFYLKLCTLLLCSILHVTYNIINVCMKLLHALKVGKPEYFVTLEYQRKYYFL